MTGEEQLRVRRVEGHACLVEISGEHDMATAPMLAEQFDSLFEHESLVIADITQTTFLDSEIVRVFETATQRAAEDPRVRFALVIDVEQGQTKRVLDLLRPLTGDIPTYSSVEAALAAHDLTR
jgi:anti-anti-sigma factor